jgi:hypothetical protein
MGVIKVLPDWFHGELDAIVKQRLGQRSRKVTVSQKRDDDGVELVVVEIEVLGGEETDVKTFADLRLVLSEFVETNISEVEPRIIYVVPDDGRGSRATDRKSEDAQLRQLRQMVEGLPA